MSLTAEVFKPPWRYLELPLSGIWDALYGCIWTSLSNAHLWLIYGISKLQPKCIAQIGHLLSSPIAQIGHLLSTLLSCTRFGHHEAPKSHLPLSQCSHLQPNSHGRQHVVVGRIFAFCHALSEEAMCPMSNFELNDILKVNFLIYQSGV